MGVAEGFEEFVTVVEEGSITAAAVRLGLPRPTLSRRLARLEDRLEVRLLHRTTRRMSLTRHGEELYAAARRVVDASHAAEAAVRRLDGTPRGLLRVALPADMPHAFLARWLGEFLTAWPEVEIEVVGITAHPDLVADGLDVAMLTGPLADPSLVIRTVARGRLMAVASPRYVAAHGLPASPAELVEHDCIRGQDERGVVERTWPLLDGGTVPVRGKLRTGQNSLRYHAALQGHGIALVMAWMARTALDAGELVAVLPETVGRTERVCLAYPDRTHLEPKVRVFVDFFADRVQTARAERMRG